MPDSAADSKLQAISSDVPASIVDQPLPTAPLVAAADAQPDTTTDPIYALNAADYRASEPRAKLRDEAPRPVGFGARSEASVEGTPLFAPMNPTGRVSNIDVRAPQFFMSSPGISTTATNAQSTSEAQSPDAGAFSNFSRPEIRSSASRLTPLPPPTPIEEDEPRTHIVVDGDSLAKLAGRYLDDPRRAEEILELNRGVLTNPDLLPIGVELVIPPRGAGSIMGSGSPQSYVPRAVAVHAAYGNGLVPVRPVPAASNFTPRARLVYPRTAD